MPTVLESLNTALHQAMACDQRVIVIGEDILDPYGGAFKVTKGLSTAYPKRVFGTPVSEAGITGIAAGMALRGLRPVVEIMFGDFTTLIADQLVNHIAKFPLMYNQHINVPLVIRTPMGGRRGYGPTHSQSLEKLYLGIPGLRVLAPCHFINPGCLLLDAILHDDSPVLFIENKLLYLLEVIDANSMKDYSFVWHGGMNVINKGEIEWFPYPKREMGMNPKPENLAPGLSLKIKDAPEPQITMVAYGYSVELARKAVEILAYQNEIFVELVILTQLSPVTIEPVINSVSLTGQLLVVEESTLSFSWGSEILARSIETLGSSIKAARRLACQDSLIPASPTLESAIFPKVDDIVQCARKMIQ